MIDPKIVAEEYTEDNVPVCADDLRAVYERFYDRFRYYLWPYKILETLANAEVEIYTSFFDKDKLLRYLEELRRPVTEVARDFEDEKLQEIYEEMVDGLNELNTDRLYQPVGRVEEVQPNEDEDHKDELKAEHEPEGDEENSESEFTEPEEGREGM